MSKYTPGPWIATRRNDGWEVTDEKLDADVCIVPLDELAEGDAQLIAKAPEMYELLKKIEEENDGYVEPTGAFLDAVDMIWDLLKEIEGGDNNEK
jgi:hypothetical protein